MNAEEVLMRELVKVVDYQPENGRITWKNRSETMFPSERAFRSWTARYAGKQIGHKTKKGYWRAVFLRRCFFVHRLAFFIGHGHLPVQVDHANRDPSDNRLCNLRDATPAENCANRGTIKSNTSGVRGVRFNKTSRKWVAYVNKNRRQIHAGSFADLKSAKEARDRLAVQVHGAFAAIEEIAHA